MKTGPLYTKLRSCGKKIIVCQGGGDAGKTVTIEQVLAVEKAIQEKDAVITITGQDVPNLRAGALRTFKRYVASDPDISKYITDFNKSDRIYTFYNGSIIEFKSFEDEQDARGSERDYLFVNEANSISYNLFWQLQRKTRKQVFIDYNPTSRFWVQDKLLSGKEKQFDGKVQLYITDHRHNPFLSEEDHLAYESISDPELFRVYSRGMTGRVMGTIYRMSPIDSIPVIKSNDAEGKEIQEPMPFGFGIDFGYNSDQSAIVKVYYDKRNRYWQVLLYKAENDIMTEIIEKGLQLTPAGYMAKILKDNGCTTASLVWGDHDKNMSAQLRKCGIPFRMARKGPNSLITGISKVKEHNNFYYRSPELEKELETYVWEKAVDQLTGNEITTTKPIDGMPDDALAAGRYFIYSHSMRYSVE